MRQHVGVSSIRIFTADRLRHMREPVVIYAHSEPLAAMVPWPLYCAWQEQQTADEHESDIREARQLMGLEPMRPR